VKPKAFFQIIEQHLDSVYNFSYRVSNDAGRAEEQTREVFLRAYLGRDKLPEEEQHGAWLMKIGVHVALGSLDGSARITFDFLDDTIRGDPTQVTRTDVLSDPERSLLLWELKQGCMTAVLNCLSLGERMAFVMVVMMGAKPAQAAASLGITPAALKVRLSRAKKKIVDYLAPRCEHVHPMNPCRCPSRLGVALNKGFIRDVVPGAEVKLRKLPPEALKPAAPVRDVVALYQQLPPARDLEELRERIREELLSGAWDSLAKKKK
jgi:RNA polymerase sigma-70 factor (ECF subfamily)